ncbi:unnamed protein product [Blepharisma stoltei]|uniref:Uncharacterized protein n=1 Tax=Blepharisma stoltei TaxID=1481888 RepID=A0AAU9ICI6_9CILI|nr:unnamed protein product [Blepharisma stoltei]
MSLNFYTSFLLAFRYFEVGIEQIKQKPIKYYKFLLEILVLRRFIKTLYIIFLIALAFEGDWMQLHLKIFWLMQYEV